MKTPNQFMGVNFSLKSMIPEIIDNKMIPILLIPNKRELSNPLSRRARIIKERDPKFTTPNKSPPIISFFEILFRLPFFKKKREKKLVSIAIKNR